ncbi:MAG: ribbon-helix-helix protein, CopG family [Rhodocyclaceae bacterium]|nr:ribbon-helix-helix protein, CopG family [Rhodocyclaceae bacterium]
MNTLTIKVPPQLETEIIEASAREHLSKSELVRRALETYLRQRKSGDSFFSALDRAGDLVGCFAGGPDDLASNPEHLADFGRV